MVVEFELANDDSWMLGEVEELLLLPSLLFDGIMPSVVFMVTEKSMNAVLESEFVTSEADPA